ncbi:MAG: hypothetical protein JXR19_06620 [Bacteroidia bacterium]
MSLICICFFCLIGCKENCDLKGLYYFPNGDVEWTLYGECRGEVVPSQRRFTQTYYDTLNLGKDTQFSATTLIPITRDYIDSTWRGTKTYHEALRKLAIVIEWDDGAKNDTFRKIERFGWFRFDETNGRMFTPFFDQSRNQVYDLLRYDYSVEVGDEYFVFVNAWHQDMSISEIWISKMKVNEIEKVSFGDNELIMQKFNQYAFLISALDITKGNLTKSRSAPSGPCIDRKTIRSNGKFLKYDYY